MQKIKSVREKLISVLLIICLMMSYMVTLSNIYVIYASDEEDQVIFNAEIVKITEDSEEEELQTDEEAPKDENEENQEQAETTDEENPKQEEINQPQENEVDQNSPEPESPEKVNIEYALKITVGIKDIGYLKNAKLQIEDLENQIFNLGTLESPIVQSVENGIIKLNTIDAKDKYELNIPLEIKKQESVNIANLQNGTKISLVGSYVNEDGEEEKVEKQGNVKIEIENNRQISINSNIEKYIKYKQDEKDYAIVQIKVDVEEKNSEIILPVKQTNLKITLPDLEVQEGKEKPEIEKIIVMAKNTAFTNGRQGQEVEFTEENFGLEDDGRLRINIENKETDGKYRNTKGKDEYLIEMTFNNAQNIENPVIKSTIEASIDLFNNLDTKQEQGLIEQEYKLDDANTNKITYDVSNLTNEISKGYLYANVNKQENFYETEYKNEIGINISKANSIKRIDINEQDESYQDSTGAKYNTTTENGTETYYKTTILNKENLVNIIGENGNLEILNDKGENLITLNKDTETNEEGNIVLSYTNKIGKILIRINNPEKEGILNIQNTKAISKSNYTKESLVAFTAISNTYIATATYDDIVSELGTKEIKTVLNGTSTRVNMEMSRGTLSTLVNNEDVQFNINLNNSSVSSDMFINPEFEIVLPKEIQTVNIKDINLLYGNDELKIAESRSFVNEQGQVVIVLKLQGTQTSFSQGDIEKGTSIVIKTDLQADLYTPNKEAKIELHYINPNATNYGSEIVDGTAREYLNIQFVGANGIVNSQRISENTDNVTVMSMNQGEKTAIIPDDSEKKDASMDLIIINNGEEVMQNPSVLGRMAFKENKTLINSDDLGTNIDVKMLDGIKEVSGDKEFSVYYSENGEATREIENPDNGWIKEPENLDNIKSFLIVPEGNINVGESLVFNYNFEIPEKLDLGSNIYGTFGTYFDTDIATKLVEAQKVGLVTEEPAEVEETEEEAEEENPNTNNNEDAQIGMFTSILESSPSIPFLTASQNQTQDTTSKKYVPSEVDLVILGDNYDKDKNSGTIVPEKELELEIDVVNKTGAMLTNSEVSLILPEGLSFVKATSSGVGDGKYNDSNRKVIWKINEINRAQVEKLYLTVKPELGTSEPSKEFEIKANISSEDLSKEYESNTLKYRVENKLVEANYYNSTGNNYVKENQEVEYILDLVNTNTIDIYDLNINSIFPEELKLISGEFEKNGQTNYMSVDNNTLNYNGILRSNEKAKIRIICMTNDISEREKVISNYITISTGTSLQKTNTLETIIQENNISGNSGNSNNGNNSGNSNVGLNGNGNSGMTGDYKITGTAWNDSNKNGSRDSGEKGIENIVVNLYTADSNSLVRKVVTDGAGGYILPNLPEGNYYAVFEYDSEVYSLTDFKKSGVSSDKNSDVILTNGQSKTDTIMIVDSSISNIDIGLIQGNIFDLSLEKTVSKITVQNDKGTNVVQGNDSTLAKTEIKSKDLNSSTVYIEYKIKVTNNGQVSGTASKIVDYLPKDASLNTEINPGWYIGKDGNAYNEELANTIINPKETKEITLIVSKAMTESNTGISSNKAEIVSSSNELGVTDIDSTPGNASSSEDDFGQADVIISIGTGGGLISTMIILTVLINLLLLGYVIKRRIDKGKEVIL